MIIKLTDFGFAQYFTNDKKLTPMGRQVAQYLKDGLAA